MKADKKLSRESENGSTTVVNKENPFIINLLPVVSVLVIVLFSILNNFDTIDMIRVGTITFLMTSVMVAFIRFKEDILTAKYSKSIVFILYSISIILTMLPINPQRYSFWMIGPLVIAMNVDKILGLFAYFNLTFIISIAYFLRPYDIIQCLAMGVLFALLAEQLKKKATVVYSSIILLSTNITLSFIMNNFVFERKNNFNYIASTFSIFGVIVIAFLMSYVYEIIVSRHSTRVEEETDNYKDNRVITDSTFIKGVRTSYDILLSENNELLLKMKDYSEALYKHSVTIGDLSGKAAKYIGANEALAQAGGYYHEVGKIKGKNYIEEGLKIAEEYGFPDELTNVLRQHNIKYDKPTFIESAIVMISDNVVSTIDYINKTEDQRFEAHKIIDNIFRMRMEKGTFDDSGLSVRNFKQLKDFYQKEFKEEESNEEQFKDGELVE